MGVKLPKINFKTQSRKSRNKAEEKSQLDFQDAAPRGGDGPVVAHLVCPRGPKTTGGRGEEEERASWLRGASLQFTLSENNLRTEISKGLIKEQKLVNCAERKHQCPYTYWGATHVRIHQGDFQTLRP